MSHNIATEQQVIDALIASKFPLMHTRQIYGKICGYWSGADGYPYRKLLKLLNDMEKRGIVYKNASVRDGAQWMLKARDVKFSLPVSGESVMRNELPF
jgi:hypothetical protein